MGPGGLAGLHHRAYNAKTILAMFIEHLPCIQCGSLIHVNPLLNQSTAQASMQVAIDPAAAQGGAEFIDEPPSWYTFFTKYVLSAEVVSIPNRIFAASR